MRGMIKVTFVFVTSCLMKRLHLSKQVAFDKDEKDI